MNFVSSDFLVFLGLVLGVYYALPNHRLQNLALVVASYVFYGWWSWEFLGLIFLSTVVDYCCGLAVDPQGNPERTLSRRRLALAISVCTNLGILATFKYFDFFSESLSLAMERGFGVKLDLPTLKIILPVGISFYTFQTMSYTIDVYRGQLSATRRFFDFMLYVSFFPQLVAGPIERGASLLPQVLQRRTFSWESFYSGAQLAMVGFAKKVLIADNLAPIVNNVFRETHPTGPQVLLATYAFAFQIYCDFSGYTDIARGVARMLGFDLCLNFRLPYFATNPSDFWQRWHISLSRWLRDYLYIPLGGNRGGTWRTYRNLSITMLLGGLWHGASWHFVIWGAYHGALLVAFRVLLPSSHSAPDDEPRSGARFWLAALCYFPLTCLGWLIFRVKSLEELAAFLKAIVFNFTFQDVPLAEPMLWVAALTLPLVAFQVYQHRSGKLEPWRDWPLAARVLLYVGLYVAWALFGGEATNDFIYFQF